MQRYIEQLIEDIHRATWRLRAPHEIWDEVDLNSEIEIEDISYAEKYIYGTKEYISEITGIYLENLPADSKLTTEQKALLAIELENLLQVFHFHLDFPNNLPSHLRYSFILKFWEEKHVPLSFGESHIEFCNYDEDECPFPGYCNTCNEIAAQMRNDEEIGKNRSNPSENNELDNLFPF